MSPLDKWHDLEKINVAKMQNGAITKRIQRRPSAAGMSLNSLARIALRGTSDLRSRPPIIE